MIAEARNLTESRERGRGVIFRLGGGLPGTSNDLLRREQTIVPLPPLSLRALGNSNGVESKPSESRGEDNQVFRVPMKCIRRWGLEYCRRFP